MYQSGAYSRLGLNACQFGETCDAVRAACLTLIKKIIMQLPIAIDLAAVVPCQPDKLDLASILPSPFAERLLEPGVKAAGMDAQ